MVGGAALADRAFHGAVLPRPAARVPHDAEAVLSPADGRIVAVERARDPYLERDALKISVFMNVFNVHSNRSPVDGEVRKAWYHGGKFFNAALDKASLENERTALWIRADRGADVTCVQIAGLIARRILCYVKPADSSRAASATASSASARAWTSTCRRRDARVPRWATRSTPPKPYWRGCRPTNRI